MMSNDTLKSDFIKKSEKDMNDILEQSEKNIVALDQSLKRIEKEIDRLLKSRIEIFWDLLKDDYKNRAPIDRGLG